ncbi:MAG TPA: hypothetical protein VGE29_13600 [Prosthecobacter sp.]
MNSLPTSPPVAAADASWQTGAMGTLAEIAIHAWRLQRRMRDKTTRQVLDDQRASHRHVEGILESLAAAGFSLRDREGEPYDYGLPERVVAAEKRPGLPREVVLETIRPSLFFQGQILRPGEIIIAVPAES